MTKTMSVPIELENPAKEAVPLDLTMKKESCAVSEVDEPEKPTGDTNPMSLTSPNAQNSNKTAPWDVSVERALPPASKGPEKPTRDAKPLSQTIPNTQNGDETAPRDLRAGRALPPASKGPEKPTRDAKPLSQTIPNTQNGDETAPRELRARRALTPASERPEKPTSDVKDASEMTVAQRAAIEVVPSPIVVVSPLPLKPIPKSETEPLCKAYWMPDLTSTRVAEKSVPLGVNADVSHQPMIPSVVIPEYNPFLPVFIPSATPPFHHDLRHQHQLQQHNVHQQQQQHHIHQQQQQHHVQQQQHHVHQQHQVDLQRHLHTQRQLNLNEQHQLQLQTDQQQQHDQEQQQTLQLQSTYGGLPLDPAYMATSLPSSSESNPIPIPFGGFDCTFPGPSYSFGYPYYDGSVTNGTCGGGDSSVDRSDRPLFESTTTTDDHHHYDLKQQQQQDEDREHNNHSNTSSTDDDTEVVEPEDIAAIYRHPDFLSFRQRYMDSLGPPKNFEKMRRSNNNSFGHKDNDHRQSQQQQHCDPAYVIKRQKNNEAAKRSRDTRRQEYIENKISVMYLTKKVSELKGIKRRLLVSI